MTSRYTAARTHFVSSCKAILWCKNHIAGFNLVKFCEVFLIASMKEETELINIIKTNETDVKLIKGFFYTTSILKSRFFEIVKIDCLGSTH